MEKFGVGIELKGGREQEHCEHRGAASQLCWGRQIPRGTETSGSGDSQKQSQLRALLLYLEGLLTANPEAKSSSFSIHKTQSHYLWLLPSINTPTKVCVARGLGHSSLASAYQERLETRARSQTDAFPLFPHVYFNEKVT